MYTKQQILNAAGLMRRTPLEITRKGEVIGDNIDIAGMLEDYNRLKNSYIPQLEHVIEPKNNHKNFPHMVKNIENLDIKVIDLSWVQPWFKFNILI
jgi:hypothetical protein